VGVCPSVKVSDYSKNTYKCFVQLNDADKAKRLVELQRSLIYDKRRLRFRLIEQEQVNVQKELSSTLLVSKLPPSESFFW